MSLPTSHPVTTIVDAEVDGLRVLAPDAARFKAVVADVAASGLTAGEVNRLLRASIEHALAHREEGLDYAMRFAGDAPSAARATLANSTASHAAIAPAMSPACSR